MVARTINRLTIPEIRAIKEPGRYSDGGGLYLVVAKGGSKQWAFLYRQGSRRTEMGLGGLVSVSLARAREKAKDAREHLADDISPLEVRRASRAVPTFGQMADEVVATLSKQWRNDKHKAGARMTLEVHAAPIREKRVNEITTDDVLAVLAPLEDRPETRSRLRARIERVLDAAKAKGFRTGENPARWRGHLDHLIAGRQKLSRGHHAAMPFAEVPAFVERLWRRGGMTALALEFLILTAARSNEVVGARWDELDLVEKVWTVPASRMKSGREHRVPLCASALAILDKALQGRSYGPDGTPRTFAFPTGGKDAPLSSNALRALLIRMKADATAHGFRSSFRDWAGEVSTFPREVAEHALAHNVGDATERAYRRGDALEKRRLLMNEWSEFCGAGQ